ncbi:AraC family transcriptional regulator [Intrasporangium oryzae NRRL B-24470]|uniref:AraC family transcriptional regulator n=1 Tax=Intrasporangium oryzae NRRL B-24470 TaxID=1386089 RepID=W9GDQ0_9MICO|nr:helix-turn-helix domain-containing protein [Intrasporangium oryzae]EWT01979.1 AraC family transcriptional regulator [Intrasporangium oryzae NRRL B-24470]
MRTIAIPVTEGMLHFELGIALEVLGSPPQDVRREDWYDVTLCGPRPVVVGPFRLQPDAGLDRLATARTVVVPGWADVDVPPPPELVEALRAAHTNGARLLSLCTGAFVLAAAGLLDGRRATTHWVHTDVLARRYPDVRVDPDVLYVEDGDVLTSAGKAAALDLCLHLIRLDHGSAVANAAARRLVVAPHREGGQAQFIRAAVPPRDDHPLQTVLPWAMQRLDQPLTVEDLARRASVTTRTLSRHFVAATGTSPSKWLHAQRIRRAQELLETSSDSVEAIAAATGMGTATTLRRHFKRTIGVPPDVYRRTFNRVGEAAGDPVPTHG